MMCTNPVSLHREHKHIPQQLLFSFFFFFLTQAQTHAIWRYHWQTHYKVIHCHSRKDTNIHVLVIFQNLKKNKQVEPKCLEGHLEVWNWIGCKHISFAEGVYVNMSVAVK